jgi:hypothetical protein
VRRQIPVACSNLPVPRSSAVATNWLWF